MITTNVEKTLTGNNNIDSIQDIYDIMDAKKTYEIHPHIGRKNIKTRLGFSLVNIGVFSDEEQKELFVDISQNEANAIPKVSRNKLRAIENSVRQELQRKCIGNSPFITKEALEEFLIFWNDKKAQYEAERDFLVEHYEDVIEEFMSKMKSVVSRLTSENKQESVLRDLRNSIPTVEQFKDSFYMNLEFSSNVDIAVFTTDVAKETLKAALEDNTRNKVRDIVGETFNMEFLALNEHYRKIQDRVLKEGKKLSDASKLALANKAKKAKQDNLFGNIYIDEIADKMKDIAKMSGLDAISDIEWGLARIYMLAKDSGILNSIDMSDSVLTVSDLTDIWEEMEEIA